MLGSQKWQKLAMVVVGGLLVFLLSQWVGNQFRRPQPPPADVLAGDAANSDRQGLEPTGLVARDSPNKMESDWLPALMHML